MCLKLDHEIERKWYLGCVGRLTAAVLLCIPEAWTGYNFTALLKVAQRAFNPHKLL